MKASFAIHSLQRMLLFVHILVFGGGYVVLYHSEANEMIELRENVLDTDTYLMLRAQVGWKTLSRNQADKSVANCLYNLVAYEDGVPVGMGRVVGDGAVVCYIQDLVVIPSSRRKNIGGSILDGLRNYVISITEPGTTMMLCLMCAKGREKFYLDHGFTARPTDNLGPGMITYLDRPAD